MIAASRPAAFLLAAVLLALPHAAGAQGGDPARIAPAVRAAADGGDEIRVIVRVREPYQPEGRLGRAAATAQRARIRSRIQGVLGRVPTRAAARRFQLIPYFAATVDAAALSRLAGDPDVVSVEEDRRARPTLIESGPLVGAPAAWASGFTGQDWTVAVLDTGVDTSHPFLAGKVVSEACYSNAGGTANGTSLCPGGAASSTAVGAGVHCGIGGCDHGTHVAGIVAGVGTNAAGIARDARLISMQVFTRFDTTADCGFQVPCLLSYASDAVLALERVFILKDTYNIAAVNMSLGAGRFFSQSRCDADNPALKAAIDTLRSAGIATVAASGNDGYFDSMSAPACISSAISVGASTKRDRMSSFTNAAPFLNLLAPGSEITSAVPGGGVGEKHGTSMAAPHVSGAWALLKQRRRSASVSQVLSALVRTGVPVTDPLTSLVFPRIRVDAALRALELAHMSLDSPASGQTVVAPFTVTGWAVDSLSSAGPGIDAVHVWAYPSSGAPIFLGVADYGGARSDIAAAFGARFANSGFGLTVPYLPAGAYQVIAYAHSSLTGAFDAERRAAIVVVNPPSQPQVAIDSPANGSTVGPTFMVAGWAIDRGSRQGTGISAVNVYAYPNPGSGAAPLFLGTARYGDTRSDIGAVHGATFANSAYGLAATLAPGRYRIVVAAHSTLSGQFTWQTRDVTVRALGDPVLAIDQPQIGAILSGPFRVSGWAIDRDSGTGSGIDTVHVWAYPVSGMPPQFLGVAVYGGPRPDVGAQFGARFANAGFDLIVSSLPPGDYDLLVYPHSVVTGAFSSGPPIRVSAR
jgi:subtilisin